MTSDSHVCGGADRRALLGAPVARSASAQRSRPRRAEAQPSSACC